MGVAALVEQLGWEGAAALVLSCPGPMRRHHASMVPMSQVKLPQCLLGCEAQLSAFAAALPPAQAARCVFAPLPEIFADPRSLARAWSGCGMTPPRTGDILHLRFGSVRTARLLKGARNAAVVAEAARPPPLATSGHPFASGLHLPAAMERMFAYAPLPVPPVRVDGSALPLDVLPPACLDADLKPRRRRIEATGLDMVSLADFDSSAWAAGPVSGPAAPRDTPLVLLPWNLDHPGSIVPDLLARLVRLQSPTAPPLRVLVLPFNYLGQTGIIRRLIAHVAAAAGDRAALAHVAIGRLTSLASLPALRALSRTAWVEAGDPEHDWTMARLTAAGFSPLALAGGEDQIWVEAETRYGTLAYRPHIPSLRELAALLDLTAAQPR